MRIAVLFAQPARLAKGDAGDIVSEQSNAVHAQGVGHALQGNGHSVACIAIGKEVPDFLPVILDFSPDVIFNLAETVDGESALESLIPNLLDFLHYAYTGSGPAALQLCLDKARTKEALIAAGIPTPPYQVVDAPGVPCADLTFPLIVKPLREDGSLGIHAASVVGDAHDLQAQIGHILQQYRQPALVEEYVGDREFNVAILGNEPPVALPLCEIDYSGMPRGLPKIVSFHAKWHEESLEYKGSMPICPAPVAEALCRQVEDIAVRAYRACGLRDYGRVDLRWDGRHAPTVIDVNPNPAISPDAGFVLSCKMAGMSYTDMLEKIVGLAAARREASP